MPLRAVLAGIAAIACASASRAEPPNVVMIIADDQAFGDFGFMGHPIIETPQLDRLAGQSARFRNGYVPSSLCRPSLATLLTGLYPHEHGVHFNDPPDKSHRRQAEYLIRAVPTLPRMLAKAGYASLQTGKFWEGHYRNAGFTHGMTHGDPAREDRHPALGLLRGRHGDVGLTIGRDSMQPIDDLIGAPAQGPFFIWYAPFLPHEPHNPPERLKQRYEGRGLHDRLVNYYAMCTWLDETVGELMRALDKHRLAENTLVVFVVDNGWITDLDRPQGFAPRSKRSPYEPGIRTPILLRFPGRIPPGDHADLVSSVDLAPTILEAAGLADDAKPLPGRSLLGVAQGRAPLDRDAVFGEIFEHDASKLGDPAGDLLARWVRVGEWKLIDWRNPTNPDQLFQLAADPDERADRIDDPGGRDRVAELRRRLDQWWDPSR
jgi:uncharacterized sulfatase